MHARNFAPKNWALCQGQLVPIRQYSALFSRLSTNFGGDGVATFRLPNLTGRVPVGQGQAPGLSNYGMSNIGGAEAVTLTAATVPPHSHGFLAFAGQGTTKSAAGALPALGPHTGGPGASVTTTLYNAAGPTVTLAPQQVMAVSGAGQPHANIQPSLALS